MAPRRFTENFPRSRFPNRRAGSITTGDFRKYILTRQKEPDLRGLNRKLRQDEKRTIRFPTNAQINRELADARRAFSLAVSDGLIFRAPEIPMLKESAARSGFFTANDIDAVCGHLPEYLAAAVRFGFTTGWRKQEILALEWSNVDFDHGRVRLDPGTTKNGEGRDFPFTEGLEKLLREQYEKHLFLKKRGRICPLVFPKPDGSRIGEFRKSWTTACKKAAVPGRLFHDLRRSAVRSFVRAGIPQTVAMSSRDTRPILFSAVTTSSPKTISPSPPGSWKKRPKNPNKLKSRLKSRGSAGS